MHETNWILEQTPPSHFCLKVVFKRGRDTFSGAYIVTGEYCISAEFALKNGTLFSAASKFCSRAAANTSLLISMKVQSLNGKRYIQRISTQYMLVILLHSMWSSTYNRELLLLCSRAKVKLGRRVWSCFSQWHKLIAKYTATSHSHKMNERLPNPNACVAGEGCLLYVSNTYVAVPGRNRTLFRCVFRSHCYVRSAIAQNFR